MALFALCALNCVMPLIPTIHRSANFRKMGQVSLILTAALLISACIVFPYSAAEAPNKLIWRQIYDLDQDTSAVTVKTMHNLEAIMQGVPAAKNRKCGPDPASNGVLTQCVYQGAVPPLVIDTKKKGEDIIKSQVSKPEYHKAQDGDVQARTLYRTVHLTWTVKDSRFCQVMFPPTVSSSIKLLKLAGFDEPKEGWRSPTVTNASRHGMTAFKYEFDQIWDLEITYEVESKDSLPLEGTLGCLYDEWDREQIPAFTNMKSHLPEWALLGGGKGPGLLTMQKTIVV